MMVVACATMELHAQPRELDWPSVDVVAHLDADGRLFVRERQAMRFTGDWNGGRRQFRVRFGQRFTFDSLVRIEPSGVRQPLVQGDLDLVDRYDWIESNDLRWRSRLPDDPPFENTTLVYELAFRYEDVLDANDDNRYVLNHDFAFSDREGNIDAFTLRLTLDPAWRASPEFTGEYQASSLVPGRGFVVRVPITRASATPPASVRTGATRVERTALALILLAGVPLLVVRLIRHDAKRGRFASPPPLHTVTLEWLEREVYAHPPEVVGVAWDDRTSEAEVAATLARMVQERKLDSRVETSKGLIFSQDELHLHLRVSRNALSGYERDLVDALFASGETRTSTKAVQERYAKTGFDPAGVIRHALHHEAVSVTGRGDEKKASRTPTLVLIVTAVVFLVIGVIARPTDGVVAFVIMFASAALYGLAFAAASDWRTRVHNIWGSGGFMFVVIAVMTLLFVALVLGNVIYRLGPFILSGLTIWILALVNSIGNRARLVLSSDGVAARRRLATAREWFREQLDVPTPPFSDAAYPYLLAFGLGPHVDKWFKAFGGESAMSTMTASRAGAYAASAGVSSSGFSGFGGGGGFSGGGGGARFGAAIGGMAASVPAPSSSSSGGSSSSSSSSGGGGGGGW